MASFAASGSNGHQPVSRSMIPMKVTRAEIADDFVLPASRKRTAIWDMHHSVHCSIIGTCLSNAEIGRLPILHAESLLSG
jgi:hypothetical protein